jgi:hypothetical protein
MVLHLCKLLFHSIEATQELKPWLTPQAAVACIHRKQGRCLVGLLLLVVVLVLVVLVLMLQVLVLVLQLLLLQERLLHHLPVEALVRCQLLDASSGRLEQAQQRAAVGATVSSCCKQTAAAAALESKAPGG